MIAALAERPARRMTRDSAWNLNKKDKLNASPQKTSRESAKNNPAAMTLIMTAYFFNFTEKPFSKCLYCYLL